MKSDYINKIKKECKIEIKSLKTKISDIESLMKTIDVDKPRKKRKYTKKKVTSKVITKSKKKALKKNKKADIEKLSYNEQITTVPSEFTITL